MEGAAALWGTPTANERASTPRAVHHGVQLANQVDVWMTPNVPNGGRTASHATIVGRTASREDGSKVQVGLEHQIKDWRFPSLPPAPTIPGGPASSPLRRSLNPLFVEWLMRWPIGWTDFACSETASIQWRRLMRGFVWTLDTGREESAQGSLL